MAYLVSFETKKLMVEEMLCHAKGLAHALHALWAEKERSGCREPRLAFKEHELMAVLAESLEALRKAPRMENGGEDDKWLIVYDFPGCRTPRHFYRLLHRLEHVRYVSRSCVLVWDENDLARLLDALRRYHARFVCFRVVEEVEL